MKFRMFFFFALVVIASTCPIQAQVATPAQSKDSFQIPATDDELPGSGPMRRAPWFQNLWTQRRGEWAKQIETDQNSVVFLGDSITQGWGNTMSSAFGNLKIANRGISGDTTRGMLFRLQEDVIRLNPKCVVMLMGTNDLEEHAEPETIASNFKLIVAELRKHNADLPLIVCKVFPSSTSKARPAEKIKKINKLFIAAVAGDSNIKVVDTWTIFADDNGDAKKEEFPDLLHPNQAGYKKWAAALRPVLRELKFDIGGAAKTDAAAMPETPAALVDGIKQFRPTNQVESWVLELTGDGKGTATIEGDAITFNVTQTGAENWHVQAYQVGFDLEEGADYIVSFEIRSPDRLNVLAMGLINHEDWHEIGLNEEIYAGIEFRKQEISFTATDVIKNNNRIGFVLGESEGSVSIKNMKLIKK